MTNPDLATMTLKDLKEVLRTHQQLLAWFASGTAYPRYSHLPNPRATSTQMQLQICLEVIAEIEREIEERAKARREGTGKVADILGAYDNMIDYASHERVTIIADREHVTLDYVRKVIRDNRGAKRKK
jgi:hypothetical protein